MLIALLRTTFVRPANKPIPGPVFCPAELEMLFLKIAKSVTAVDESAQGIYNPWKDIIKAVIVDPNLTDATDWYLFASSEAIKPSFIRIESLRGWLRWIRTQTNRSSCERDSSIQRKCEATPDTDTMRWQ
jgi:hypothetical protein